MTSPNATNVNANTQRDYSKKDKYSNLFGWREGTGTRRRMETDLNVEQDNDAAILHHIADAFLNLDEAVLLNLTKTKRGKPRSK